MSRVVIKKGEQKAFLQQVKRKLNAKWSNIAEICGVHERTFFDWRREKYQMSFSALEKLSELSGIPKPANIKILERYWYVRKGGKIGAIRRHGIYGNPGTPEGRRKGGLISQKKRRENPELYIGSGVILKKLINYPPESKKLAEFIGIMLGDGNITNYQIRTYVNSESDAEYALFIKKLISDLFHTNVSLKEYEKRQDNTITITASGVNLVKFLLEKGLKRGDKIAQQVDIPDWIFSNIDFQRACVRGLIDTDGSIYYHNHEVKGKRYRNIGMCFTTFSDPLLRSVYQILLNLNFTAKYDNKAHVFLYRQSEVGRYLKEVGTNNPKHLNKYNQFLLMKF